MHIDIREPDRMIHRLQSELDNRNTSIELEKKQLKTGDFVSGDTVIERKEASDLASSIQDRRLKEQATKMLADFQRAVLIIEGNPFDLQYSNIVDNAIIGSMISRSEDGLEIILTPSMKGTAYAVYKLAEDSEDKQRDEVTLERTKAETEDLNVALLSCIRGISKSKAEKIDSEVRVASIVEHIFDPSKEVENIREEITEIPGIGETLSDRILDGLSAEKSYPPEGCN